MSQRISPEIKSENVCYPLDEFYIQQKLPLPSIEFMEAAEVPQPYQGLLVHTQDMTSTLENFHREKIHLNVLQQRRSGGAYFREVALILDRTRKIVEFGAIRIYLNRFEEAPKQLIVQGELPLGRIIQDFQVPFVSRPSAFLKIESDALINSIFKLSHSCTLYGRQNTLSDPHGRPLAEIVEILPPVHPNNGGGG